MALVLAMCASLLWAASPRYETILMLGPFESGKVRTVLWGLAVVALGLAVLVPLTMILLRPETWWGDGLAVLLWIPALPFVGVVLLGTGLYYDSRPETHRFAVGGHDYLLASQIGFLIANDHTYLDLYQKDGHIYRRVGLRLPIADTAGFENDGFFLDRQNGDVSLVYTGAGDEQVRVRIP